MDICGPIRVRSRGGKMYVFVIIDDFSTFTWTLFLASKEVSFETLTIFFQEDSENSRIILDFHKI